MALEHAGVDGHISRHEQPGTTVAPGATKIHEEHGTHKAGLSDL